RARCATAARRPPAVMPDVDIRAGGDGPLAALTTDAAADAVRSAGGVAEQPALFGAPAASETRPLFGRVLGQVQDTFVVSTFGDEVFFLDQHVPHERVLCERIRREMLGGVPAAQTLLFPEPLELPPAACALLERWREPLERLGFAFEGFGGPAIVVRAVPALLKASEPRRL